MYVKNATTIQMRDEVNPNKIIKNTTKITNIPIFFGDHDSPGSSFSAEGYLHVNDAADLTTITLCNNSDHAEWDIDTLTCSCKKPFWGRKCEREVYSSEFMAIGNINPNNLEYFLSKVVDRQSFLQNLDQTTCDDLCRSETDCVGYVITPTSDKKFMCNLLDSIPEYSPDIKFDPAIDSNLFLKKTSALGRPTLFDRVILYNGKLRPRFWMDSFFFSDHHNLINVGIGIINKLSFYPTGIVNDAKNILVFSNSTFTYPQALQAIKYYRDNGKQLTNFHVHIPGTNDYSLPFQWNIKNLWLMAISSKDSLNITKNIKKTIVPSVIIYPPIDRIPQVGSPIKTLSESLPSTISSASSSSTKTKHPTNTESLSIFSGWSE